MLILVIFGQDIFVNVFNNIIVNSIVLGKHFLRGSYLKPERSRNISQNMFSLVPGNVLCDPDEVFEVFVDINSDLSMSKDSYFSLFARSL